MRIENCSGLLKYKHPFPLKRIEQCPYHTDTDGRTDAIDALVPLGYTRRSQQYFQSHFGSDRFLHYNHQSQE